MQDKLDEAVDTIANLRREVKDLKRQLRQAQSGPSTLPRAELPPLMNNEEDDNTSTWSKMAIDDLLNHPGPSNDQALFSQGLGLTRVGSGQSLGLVRDSSFRWSEIGQIAALSAPQSVSNSLNQPQDGAAGLETMEPVVAVSSRRSTRNSRKRPSVEAAGERRIRYKQDPESSQPLLQRGQLSSAGDSDEGESVITQGSINKENNTATTEQERLMAMAAVQCVTQNMANLIQPLSNEPMALPLSTTNAAIEQYQKAALEKVDSCRSLSDYLSDELAPPTSSEVMIAN